MPNELPYKDQKKLVDIALQHNIKGFIFSNLVKKRDNPGLDSEELEDVKSLKGNFSGKPAQDNADDLVFRAYKDYGDSIVIVGCGGVFNAEDAYRKIRKGASLVQLITGMIYEGPQLIGEINEGLVEFLKKDDFNNISQAVGAYHKKV